MSSDPVFAMFPILFRAKAGICLALTERKTNSKQIQREKTTGDQRTTKPFQQAGTVGKDRNLGSSANCWTHSKKRLIILQRLSTFFQVLVLELAIKYHLNSNTFNGITIGSWWFRLLLYSADTPFDLTSFQQNPILKCIIKHLLTSSI